MDNFLLGQLIRIPYSLSFSRGNYSEVDFDFSLGGGDGNNEMGEIE